MFEVQRSTKEGDVRVTTAFNRMLGLPGAWVRDVAFGAEAVIVTVCVRVQEACLLGLRRPRLEDQGSPREALAASRSRRLSMRDRVPTQTALLPRLRRCV